MASKIPQLQSKVTQASEVVANNGASYYKLLMEQNKHYIQDPPTIEKCQSLAKQLFYTRLARLTLLLVLQEIDCMFVFAKIENTNMISHIPIEKKKFDMLNSTLFNAYQH